MHDDCDYCGERGHHWSVHPQARADVTAWGRETVTALAPFGDHREGL